jgi:hypothetical protein
VYLGRVRVPVNKKMAGMRAGVNVPDNEGLEKIYEL